jgi:hypothetical protein
MSSPSPSSQSLALRNFRMSQAQQTQIMLTTIIAKLRRPYMITIFPLVGFDKYEFFEIRLSFKTGPLISYHSKR